MPISSPGWKTIWTGDSAQGGGPVGLLEAHQHPVPVHQDGPLHQHAVPGQEGELLGPVHGIQPVLQAQGPVGLSAGVEELL